MEQVDLKNVKQTAEYYNVDDSGLISAEEYRNRLILEEQEKALKKKELEMKGVTTDADGNPIYPPAELDDYLASRKRIKAAEFRELRDKQGFYFSDVLNEQALYQQRANEGMFLIGTNLAALLDLFRQSIFEKGTEQQIPKSDVLASGRSYEIIGEYIDMDKEYDKLQKDIIGLRLGPGKVLKPEDTITETSLFDNILNESEKYTGFNSKFVTPNALFNMVRILDKYKKSEVQWLRVATALEIIYQYMNNGEPRELFFKSTKILNKPALYELDEFFRTDHIFMSLEELLNLKKSLEFYRAVPGTAVGIDKLGTMDLSISAVKQLKANTLTNKVAGMAAITSAPSAVTTTNNKRSKRINRNSVPGIGNTANTANTLKAKKLKT